MNRFTVTKSTRVDSFKRGDRINIGGRVAVVLLVQPTRLTLAYRDAWYWRALRHLEADYDRTRDRWIRAAEWLGRLGSRLLALEPFNAWE